MKPQHSVAGRGVFRSRGALDDAGRAWLRRELRRGPVVLQPWLERQGDLSAVATVQRDGRIELEGHTEMMVRGGTWQESRPGRGAVPPALASCALAVGERLAGIGYWGPFGVDALVTVDGTLQPLIEINARWTMGRVALISDRVGGSRRRE